MEAWLNGKKEATITVPIENGKFWYPIVGSGSDQDFHVEVIDVD